MQQGVGVHGGEVDLGDAGRVSILGPTDQEVPGHWDGDGPLLLDVVVVAEATL